MGENEQLVRSAFDSFSRGSLDETMATLDPAIEWHVAFRIPDLPPNKTVMHGHDEVRELWAKFGSVWEELTVEVEDVLYDADDIVIAQTRFRGRGAGSGVEADRTFFYVVDVREGKAVRIRPFDDLGEARRAAGLAA